MIETPIPPDDVEIFSIQSSLGVPPGMAVMVGPDKIVVWMGVAGRIPMDHPWKAGSVLNMSPRDFDRVKHHVATREKGIRLQ